MKGKIIAITGGPRTGKSTLVRLLAEKLGAEALFEGEEKDFPNRILEDIKTRNNVLELILWFRNKGVGDYLKALEIKKSGKIAILDTFWATNDVYINEWVADEFEKGVLKNLAKMDYELLPWPNLVISLHSNEEKIREFVIAGGRIFELESDFLQKQFILNDAHENYFRKLGKPNIKFIETPDLNFLDPKQLDNFVTSVKNFLD